jgi:hypothetical protein
VDQSAPTTKDTYDLGSARSLPTAPRRKGRTFGGPRGDRANWELTHVAQVADDSPLGFGRERGLDWTQGEAAPDCTRLHPGGGCTQGEAAPRGQPVRGGKV